MQLPSGFRAFLHRLRTAGIEPSDNEELRLQKSLLFFISGLISLAASIWLFVYWAVGPELSVSLPFILQVIVALNLVIYACWGQLDLFRMLLLLILLFFPFTAQWALGGFVAASGLALWGMLSPICALLVLGMRESIPWFAAYLILTLATGAADYALVHLGTAPPEIPRDFSALFFALNFAMLSSMIYYFLRFATQERSRVQALLEEAHARLEAEQLRSEHLLLNVLPETVALRLKRAEQGIADGYPEVAVMFVDIVRFTELAAGREAQSVFALLNHVFSHFDDLAEKHGLEKIKTIGDAYMVAGGLDDRLDDPCAAMAELALDMRAWLAEDNAHHDRDLQIRIGIATGPVVAGVVGRRKFIYDLWGDTVNLASRITGESLPGVIQCDSATFSRLKYRFLFEDPVTLRLKGKGMVSVWRLLGPAPQAAPAMRFTTLDIDVGDGT
ncbi:MAG: adenylate/guanylate cyclase domain-containing protein [Candidatus Dactylopiibacterium carminicum]|uniref:Adenylate/guanylate cyclase domain-containing protein n=2 Tax=Candidatus Dactylopiibacterium carminicum TaxID=857335 RepID=A0A272ERF0_9RHOO|nr:adenylate/guanylate cyclase domain-containing protein [Candidatus Dactylopiibacterium carminicum]PAS92699.1 MAG: adenylate/guanylate cyclase domain-containing protein [Candidatus Dactylopiibacterium carminicum]PAS94742.1 MAG: adenylate/guanylate cyclase domain-containing protein [Candidatus Dactylopiibacterium carminicum]